VRIASLFAISLFSASSAYATPYFFSTGDVTSQMAMASRPAGAGKFEIETADDFVLADHTSITSATFNGLLTGNASVGAVRVEIYRVFPQDSNSAGVPQVPTRVNSPSDVAIADRDSSIAGMLAFSTSVLAATFTTNNSVQPGGVHSVPNQTTGGNGPLTGKEVKFDVTFGTGFDLLAGHYFFVPQVEIIGGSGEFYWLSASKPIVSPGTPFIPDLQTWTRDETLDPDWLRVGTDIVGGTTPSTFNAAFSLSGNTVSGTTVPEPNSLALIGLSALALVVARRRRSSRSNR
jgi:hypothetical protein